MVMGKKCERKRDEGRKKRMISVHAPEPRNSHLSYAFSANGKEKKTKIRKVFIFQSLSHPHRCTIH